MAGPIAINHPIASELDWSSISDLSVSPSDDGAFSDVPLSPRSASNSESAADSSETRVDSEGDSRTLCSSTRTPGPEPSSLSDESKLLNSHELDANNDRRPWRNRTHSLEGHVQCRAPDVDTNTEYYTFVSSLCEPQQGSIPPNQRDAPLDASDAHSLDGSDNDSVNGLSEEDLMDAFEGPDAVDRFADDSDQGFLADVSSDANSSADSDSDSEHDDYDSDYDDDNYDAGPGEVEYVSERVTPTVMTLCAITEEERTGLALGLYDISRFMRPAFLTANGEIRDVPEESAPAPTSAASFGLGLPVPPRASFGRSASFESVNLHDDDSNSEEAREDREYDVVRPASPAVRNTSIATPILLESPGTETRPPFFAVDEKDAPLLPISGIATAIATAMREVMGINEPGAVLPDRD